MNIDFQVNLNQPLNFTAVILAHATLRLRYATPQSRQSPDGSFLKNIKRAVKEQINLLLHRSFYIFRRMARCFTQKSPAMSYPPRQLPTKYFRRWKTLLLCSVWEQVWPFRHHYETNLALFCKNK